MQATAAPCIPLLRFQGDVLQVCPAALGALRAADAENGDLFFVLCFGWARLGKSWLANFIAGTPAFGVGNAAPLTEGADMSALRRLPDGVRAIRPLRRCS